jgi:hypothetical protein
MTQSCSDKTLKGNDRKSRKSYGGLGSMTMNAENAQVCAMGSANLKDYRLGRTDPAAGPSARSNRRAGIVRGNCVVAVGVVFLLVFFQPGIGSHVFAQDESALRASLIEGNKHVVIKNDPFRLTAEIRNGRKTSVGRAEITSSKVANRPETGWTRSIVDGPFAATVGSYTGQSAPPPPQAENPPPKPSPAGDKKKSSKLKWILIAAAAGAVGVVLVTKKSGDSSSSGSSTPGITIGNPTVGAPQ